jgi:ribosomal protein S18 acetylase RimI-like enzyme
MPGIREIRPAEYHLLEDFCYQLIFVPPGRDALSQDVIFDPSVHAYIKDFGKPDDLCLVAEHNGIIVGAAWSRILAEPGRQGFGYIDDKTPELAIAVLPEYRGKGIGTALLLTTLIDRLARRGYESLSLSVQKENPAAGLYRQLSGAWAGGKAHHRHPAGSRR